MVDRPSALVDSSLWIDFLSGGESAVARLTALRRSHRLVICGQVRQEVLQGARSPAALAKLERAMAIWDCEPEQPEDFVKAARTYARLRWQGVTVPPSDCLIAAVARRSGLAIAASDPHFAKIPDVRLVEG
jgi:predicted nucleic acid-binding protein